MQKTAIELIPQDENYLREKIEAIKDCDYDIINLPHLTPKQNWKVTFLSPEAIATFDKLLPEEKELILHLRTTDSASVLQLWSRIQKLFQQKVSNVLLISWNVTQENAWKSTWKATWMLYKDTEKIAVCADIYQDNWWMVYRNLWG